RRPSSVARYRRRRRSYPRPSASALPAPRTTAEIPPPRGASCLIALPLGSCVERETRITERGIRALCSHAFSCSCPLWNASAPLPCLKGARAAALDTPRAPTPPANNENPDKMDERKDKTFGGRRLTASARV